MKNSGKFIKSDLLSILILLIVNFILKVPLTSLGFFAFAYDQGRDFLAVSKIIYEKNLTLIGPNTGLEGVFYGPSWYYFLSPILYLSRGDPRTVAIIFSLLGIVTIIFLYLLIRYLTGSTIIALSLSLVSSMSKSSGLGPINIWSPSLVPILVILFIYLVNKIFTSPKPVYYFLLGFVTVLTSDFGAASGIVLTLFLLVSPIIFPKYFLKKEFIFTLIGAFLVFLPRIIFDLKNNFLISSSILSYLGEPKIYGDQLPIYLRLLGRLEQFFYVFASAIARNNFYLMIAEIIFVLALFIIFYKKRKSFTLKNKTLIIHLLYLITFFLIAFSIYPDIVWDYYLVGIPTVFVILVALLLANLAKIKNIKWPIIVFLTALVIINFNKTLIYPARITWLGDGATYRNPKMVIDYVASQNPQNYSLYSYSPAIFDYPIDYLIFWYTRKNLIEKPKENQGVFYLVIREASTNQYLASGWYGDKTKDKTKLMERREFPGDLVLEKHIKNE